VIPDRPCPPDCSFCRTDQNDDEDVGMAAALAALVLAVVVGGAVIVFLMVGLPRLLRLAVGGG
jgi:hypothetical protein